jgi:hypothetical protein
MSTQIQTRGILHGKELMSLQTSSATSQKIKLKKIRDQILLLVKDIPKLMDKLIITARW